MANHKNYNLSFKTNKKTQRPTGKILPMYGLTIYDKSNVEMISMSYMSL